MDWLLETTNLTQGEFLILLGLTMFAGVVRGFSGFALSAMVMATAVVILPPVELIPMLWWLEMSASLLMLKNGWAEADRPMAYGLVIGALVGWPIGLWLTLSLPVEISKALALSVIVVLAISQLAKLKLPFLASKAGLYGTGTLAGIASGVAHVGGMVVAFYVLAADKPAHVMRASLVLYLFLGSATSMLVLLLFGVMDFSGISRGLVFAVPTMIGVLMGQLLFTERLSAYYRPVCLILLIGLALLGLIRTQFA
ncbi:sulfite exporter TauE/SafE family protein [Octadecabacter ascidiaceicola]|uniref:Probable membrane transporter protein n=1 Tax=Octadecabacter ascidiaceicola TaxID=1655543 RepID=A0A238KN26_9RHOB|nr:sulfite exporter TauE/SafE family protein [Octadecabacter ascidiaceicola]SMX43476.1 Sulfite exporter TauE/SafE [Octadecabacter ascidiaceicola]